MHSFCRLPVRGNPFSDDVASAPGKRHRRKNEHVPLHLEHRSVEERSAAKERLKEWLVTCSRQADSALPTERFAQTRIRF